MPATATLHMPQEKGERNRLRDAIRDYVLQRSLVPPLSMEELDEHSRQIAASIEGAEDCRGLVTVLLSNEVWRDTLAGVPFERRLLLLPQCLRDSGACPAELDEFGLMCEECGQCPIGEIQAEAEELGYVVLVADGTTVVTQLLARGKVDAVLGVSCLSALERSFPHMASHAIPGLAIPLFKNGCVDTAMDIDWLKEALHMKSNACWSGREDLDRLRADVESWFEDASLVTVLGAEGTKTEDVARLWLSKGGHRWRPFLAAGVFRALEGAEGERSESMKRLAVAVECFHKASLVHDDIEDDDDMRYGEETLHEVHGVPVALNAGDLLIGEGYRLITDCKAPPEQTIEIMRVASDGHRTLCLGQGEELASIREGRQLSSTEVLDIFRRKTAPAFDVALQIGAIHGGAGTDVRRVLTRFSESLGVAYQIKDDLRDASQDGGKGRLSLVSALERGSCENAREKASQLLEHYRNEAIRSLSSLRNAHLKGLLRRVVTRIVDSD